MRKIAAILMLLCTICTIQAFAAPLSQDAERQYVNDNGYNAYIADNAELFDDIGAVLDSMKPITEYTNVLLCTVEDNDTSAARLAERLAESRFRTDEGVVFLIDMDNRELYIYAHNEAYDVITSKVAYTITDNVYRHASNEEYDKCVIKAFEQIYRVFKGERIPESMRYIGNAFLAIMLGISACTMFACYSSRVKVKAGSDILVKTTCDNPNSILINVTRTRHSSSSGGGGGGGGGGGSSGGGGGHGF